MAKKNTAEIILKNRALILERAKLGDSQTQMCSKLGVSQTSWRLTCNKDDECNAIRDEFMTVSQAYWEERLKEAATDKVPGNVTALIFLMKSRFPETYGERQQVEHSGGISLSVNINTVPDAKI